MMEEKFDWMSRRFEELSVAVTQPEIIADLPRFQKCVLERAQLEPKVEAWKKYQEVLSQLSQAEELLSVPDMAEIAKEELEALKPREEELRAGLRLFLLPPDPDENRNVVCEVRAGAGGDEASLFAALLTRMYARYAERHNFKMDTVSVSDTELGGVKEAVFTLTGKGVWGRMKYESGVHRIQRVPVTEAGGRIHTSTATVAVLPEAEDVEVDISPNDLKIDVYRSSGHGGQCVNTTDSAVRITHLPTGLVVTCQDEKSQIKNRDKALRVLRSRLLSRMRAEAHDKESENRREQVGTGERSERIRTYNFREGRVTDHRLSLVLYRIDEIMDGDLDEFVDKLSMEEQARRLRELSIS